MEIYRFIELTAYSLLRIVPYLLLFLYVFKGHFRFPKWVTITAVALISILRCLCGYVAFYNTDSLSKPNPGILIFVVLAILFVKDRFGKSLFSLWMLANISGFAVIAAKYFEGLIFGDNMALELHRYSNVITLALVEIAVLIPIFFYIKHIYFKAVHQDTSKQTWRLLWLVPFTLYVVWYKNSFFSNESHELLSLSFRYVFYCLLVSGGGMLIYTLVAYMINEHTENDRLREKEHLFTLQQAQYENLQERIEEARTAKHDMRQHLHIISAYVKDKKYDELEAYIGTYRASVPENAQIIYCEHYEVNALLQYFAGLAKQHGIGFSAQVHLPKDIGIAGDALTVLLGNLLENAVHACLTEQNAVISVRGMADENGVFFKIFNTFTGKVKKAPNGLYLSTKRDGRGIGLRSVRNIVSNHSGVLKIDHEGGFFTVEVLLNIQNYQ